MNSEKALSLNQLLTPLFIRYGFVSNGPERLSRRACKHEASYQAWSDRKGLAIFVYDDASVGLRDGNVSMQVELDLNMAEPQSIRRLKGWMKAKRKAYDHFQAP